MSFENLNIIGPLQRVLTKEKYTTGEEEDEKPDKQRRRMINPLMTVMILLKKMSRPDSFIYNS